MSKKKNTKAKKNDVPVVIEVFGERAREAHRSAVLLGWPADYIVGKEPCNDAVFVRAPSKEAADIFTAFLPADEYVVFGPEGADGSVVVQISEPSIGCAEEMAEQLSWDMADNFEDLLVVAPSRRAAERFAAFFGDNAKITDIDPDEVV